MSLKSEYPLYIANRAEMPNLDLEVTDKFSGEVATRVPLASPEMIDRAIAASVKAAVPMAKMKPYERQAVLRHCVKRFEERFDSLRKRTVGHLPVVEMDEADGSGVVAPHANGGGGFGRIEMVVKTV